MWFFIYEKVNNSIATKLSANILNSRLKKKNVFSALHNSMIKLCIALFKCENRLKNGWEN